MPAAPTEGTSNRGERGPSTVPPTACGRRAAAPNPDPLNSRLATLPSDQRRAPTAASAALGRGFAALAGESLRSPWRPAPAKVDGGTTRGPRWRPLDETLACRALPHGRR